jgi:hypothetical protein
MAAAFTIKAAAAADESAIRQAISLGDFGISATDRARFDVAPSQERTSTGAQWPHQASGNTAGQQPQVVGSLSSRRLGSTTGGWR